MNHIAHGQFDFFHADGIIETMFQKINEKFKLYEKLLAKQKINLVAPSTMLDIRGRHIDDSKQLADYIPINKTVVDLGSRAGFPAAVLAILGYKVIAIESTLKKCKFLDLLKKELNLPNLTILNERVEKAIKTLPKINSVFTARAFAPLIKIFDLTASAHIPYVLLKGRSIKDEITIASKKYKFDFELFPSKTGDGFIGLFHVK